MSKYKDIFENLTKEEFISLLNKYGIEYERVENKEDAGVFIEDKKMFNEVIIDEDLIDSIHDTLVDLSNKEPSRNEILNIINVLPKSILSIGHEWGYYDTVFRDEVYKWIVRNILVK